MSDKNRIIKLIMFKDFKEVKTIIEPNTESNLHYIIYLAEKWKNEDKKRNTINISFEESSKD